MLSPVPTLPAPSRQDHPSLSPWIEEQMWGHRIWDAQSPWLLFLEFLTVAEACHREGRLLKDEGYPLLFKPRQRMFLRNLLFNNEQIRRFADEYADSRTAWERWIAWMNEHAVAIAPRDFSYLKARFPSFQAFASLLGMLNGAVVESESNKRWTSRFIFPFGPHALYEDTNVTPAGTTSREYIHFGRTGELLYLMLSRSQEAGSLRPYLQTLFSGTNRWDALLEQLQPKQDENLALRGKSYLPYASHPSFDALAKDWLQLLSYNLSGFDAYPYLVTLSALHIMLYHLRVAAEWSRLPSYPVIVCEVVAPKKTLVRELSSSNFQENTNLSVRAVETYLADIEASESWQQALGDSEAFARCRDILRNRCWWEGDPDSPPTPMALMADLRTTALTRHRQHVTNVHRSYGRAIGLVSRRGTNRMRYAPTDRLLKTLVVANVPARLELGQFLERLYDQYGFVFGDVQAERVLTSAEFDKKAFQANTSRLEQRLGSLGLLRRLSDACAYVENPLGRRGR